MDIAKIASSAQIYLMDGEAERVARELAPIIFLADSLPGDDKNPAEGVAAIDISDLREDTPVREIDPSLFIEQSPSGGGGGFTIKRLLE